MSQSGPIGSHETLRAAMRRAVQVASRNPRHDTSHKIPSVIDATAATGDAAVFEAYKDRGNVTSRSMVFIPLELERDTALRAKFPNLANCPDDHPIKSSLNNRVGNVLAGLDRDHHVVVATRDSAHAEQLAEKLRATAGVGVENLYLVEASLTKWQELKKLPVVEWAKVRALKAEI